jgi:hypothetical protein
LLIFFDFSVDVQRTSMVELIRTTEVPAFSLPMTIGRHQAHKTRFGSLIKAYNSESGLKSFCPKDLGVSGKIIGACGKNFCRNPKRFFCVNDAVLHLQT